MFSFQIPLINMTIFIIDGPGLTLVAWVLLVGWWHKRWLVAVAHFLAHSGWAAFALYPHKGLTDHKLIMGHFPWLDGLYLVDIITLVPPCVLVKALEVQFPLRANEVDQTYLHIVAGLGYLSAHSFGLDLGCQHLVHVGLYVFPCSA